MEKFTSQASSCYYSPELPEPQDFSSIHNSMMRDTVPPIYVKDNLEKLCGKYRGIQGHHNSCYLDATLFSMFAFTYAFDSLLFR